MSGAWDRLNINLHEPRLKDYLTLTLIEITPSSMNRDREKPRHIWK